MGQCNAAQRARRVQFGRAERSPHLLYQWDATMAPGSSSEVENVFLEDGKLVYGSKFAVFENAVSLPSLWYQQFAAPGPDLGLRFCRAVVRMPSWPGPPSSRRSPRPVHSFPPPSDIFNPPAVLRSLTKPALAGLVSAREYVDLGLIK